MLRVRPADSSIRLSLPAPQVRLAHILTRRGRMLAALEGGRHPGFFFGGVRAAFGRRRPALEAGADLGPHLVWARHALEGRRPAFVGTANLGTSGLSCHVASIWGAAKRLGAQALGAGRSLWARVGVVAMGPKGAPGQDAPGKGLMGARAGARDGQKLDVMPAANRPAMRPLVLPGAASQVAAVAYLAKACGVVDRRIDVPQHPRDLDGLGRPPQGGVTWT